MGRGVLLCGPGPIVAGGRAWEKLLEEREGGLRGGSREEVGGGGGFMEGWAGGPAWRALKEGLEFGTWGLLLLLGGGGGAPAGFSPGLVLCGVVGLGLGEPQGEEF